MTKKSKKRNRPTVYDVAELAGVSQTTVSFVINDTPGSGITNETKQRVLDAVKELGYRQNVIAKQLHSKRSHTIGLITDEIAISPHAGWLIHGAEDVARNANKTVLLTDTGEDLARIEAAVETMLERQVDGIIYATMRHRKINPPAILSEAATILVNCYDDGGVFPAIVPDDFKAGMDAANILLQKGHRHIGFINGINPSTAVRKREAGFRQALAANGVPFREELVCYEPAHPDGGYKGAHQLLQLPSPPTALFCFNDQMAMGAYDALRERHLKIPQDVAVIGFDNFEVIAAYLRPRLSTMALPHYQMGQLAAQHLIDMVDQGKEIDFVQHKIQCPYIERNSV